MPEKELSPKEIKRKFLLVNLMGYGYIFLVWILIGGFAVFLLVVGAVLHVVAILIKFIIALFVIAVALFRATWVPIKAPKGRVLMPFEAPKFFQLLEEVRKKLGVPKIYKVIITSDFNASVVQHPRFGILGGTQNYLMLGLPFLETLSVEQFKAVLAHEMCHLSKKHGVSSLWSYRLITVWRNLSNEFEGKKKHMHFVFKPFFKKFMPYYHKVSKAYFRQHEYESDSFSADFMGKEEAAKTLLRIEIMGAAVTEYWNKLDKSVRTQDLPPMEVYLGYIKYMREAFALENVKELLISVMRKRTMKLDSHPCLTERLNALGFSYAEDQIVGPGQKSVSFKDNIETSAAQMLIDAALVKQWHDGLVKDWDENYKKQWYRIREGYYADQKKLKELLDKEGMPDALTLKERWEKAKLLNHMEQSTEANIELRLLIENNYEVGAAKMLLGKNLLGNDDPAGINLMEEGIKLDSQYGLWASQELMKYYEKHNDTDKIKWWYDKLLEYSENARVADLERKHVMFTDKFKPHEAKEDFLELIRTKASDCPDVKRVFLVCKQVERTEYKPVFLMVVQLKRKFFVGINYTKQYQDYFKGQVWPEHVFIAVNNGNLKFVRKVNRIPNALVFEKK